MKYSKINLDELIFMDKEIQANLIKEIEKAILSEKN
jgi:hypothetical protein